MRLVNVLLLCCLAATALAALPCGEVLDGNGKEDAAFQSSTSSIAAHWHMEADLEVDRVLRYEWAVISQDKYTENMKTGLCRTEPGFDGFPDVLDWTSTGMYTFAKEAVSLENGKTYFVVVRATTARGAQVYANTNGITVDAKLTPQPLRRTKVQLDDTLQHEKRAHLLNPVGTCPIDDANRCAQSKISVGDFLLDKYGPPLFARRTREAFLTNGDDEDDDDDSTSDSSSSGGGLPVGAVIGIALGVAGLLLLLCAGFALASALVGSKSDKFKTNVGRGENVEEF